jgi:uncharacterized protein (DUF1330 family)
MPAYFVYMCQEVVDRSELEIYWSKIGPTLEGYGAKSVAAYTPFEHLEGDAVDGAAVVEFPSMEVAPVAALAISDGWAPQPKGCRFVTRNDTFFVSALVD